MTDAPSPQPLGLRGKSSSELPTLGWDALCNCGLGIAVGARVAGIAILMAVLPLLLFVLDRPTEPFCVDPMMLHARIPDYWGPPSAGLSLVRAMFFMLLTGGAVGVCASGVEAVTIRGDASWCGRDWSACVAVFSISIAAAGVTIELAGPPKMAFAYRSIPSVLANALGAAIPDRTWVNREAFKLLLAGGVDVSNTVLFLLMCVVPVTVTVFQRIRRASLARAVANTVAISFLATTCASVIVTVGTSPRSPWNTPPSPYFRCVAWSSTMAGLLPLFYSFVDRGERYWGRFLECVRYGDWRHLPARQLLRRETDAIP